MASVVSKKQKKKNTKGERSLSDLKTLGHELLSSRAHINNLPLLLNYVSPTSPPPYVLEVLLSLQAFFTPVLPELPPSSSATKSSANSAAKDDPEFIYRTWLRLKFDELVNSLIEIYISPETEEALREVVLDATMEFVKVGNGGKFHTSIYHRLIYSIVHSAIGIDESLEYFASKYFNYVDIRYFTYITIEKLARTLETKDISDAKSVSPKGDNNQNRASVELSTRKLLYILKQSPALQATDNGEDLPMWNSLGVFTKGGDTKEHLEHKKAGDKHQVAGKSTNNATSAANISKKMKVKFSKAWISFLRLSLPLDVYKEVLVTLHQAVLPHLTNPILLSDFLTRSYDIGGVISVMSLSGLYILMVRHGLEYPNLYEKLYTLLEPSIFMAKHRAKFFELLDSCLKSPLLPAHLTAAFAKKLSRLSLSVPPSGSLVITALIQNLLQSHPSISCLINRVVDDAPASGDLKAQTDGESKDSCAKELGIDHFNNDEANPAKTNAMRSSLWEIDTLRHHYCPPVSRFVSTLESELTAKRKMNLVSVADFSSGSYATIFGEEIGRRVKQVPLAFYKATPNSLFSESDFAGWTFKHEDSVADTSKDVDHSSLKRQRVAC